MRSREIAHRDDCNKLRSANAKLQRLNSKLTQELDEVKKKQQTSYQEFKDFNKQLTRKESKLKECNRTIGRLEAGMIEFTSLLEDTLNVKLRYEEIIKRIM